MTTLTKDQIDEMVAGRTVASEFLTTLAAHADRTALRWMTGESTWDSMTFEQMADRAARAAAGLRELGVVPGDRVVLMMRNIPEFHYLDLAVLFLGATPVSIYNSSSPEQVAYLVGHCEAKVAIVENDGFLSKFLEVRDELPELRTIVVLVAPPELPEGVRRPSCADRPGAPGPGGGRQVGSPDDLATMIYTSGTTGPPKGVMLSDDNMVWTMEAFLPVRLDEDLAGKKVVSYLPMAHIAERMVSHYMLLGGGSRCHLPRNRRCSPPTSVRCTRTSCSVCPACGRSSTRGDRGAGRRPGEGRAVQRGGRGGHAHQGEDDLGHRHRGPVPPTSSSTTWRSAPSARCWASTSARSPSRARRRSRRS